MKVINRPGQGPKKREAKKSTSPLVSPYGEKAKGKEQSPDACAWSQYRAHVCAWMHMTGWTNRRRYDEAGAVADEIMANCFGTIRDHHKWASRMYAYPWALAAFREQAYIYASCHRDGRLRNPVTAFQSWINRCYPDPERAKGNA